MIEAITPHIPNITLDTMSLPDEHEGQYKEKRKHRMRKALPRIAGAMLGLGLLASIYRPYKPALLPIDNSPKPHVLEQDANIRWPKNGVINFVVQNFAIVDTASAQEPEDGVQIQIVGGRPVKPGEWPFMVVLFHTGKPVLDDHYCGGAALTNIHVLTAGHCTERESASQISIFTGIDLTDPGSGEKIQVLEVYRPSCFDPEWLTCDFAILKLSRPLTTITDFAIVDPSMPKPGEIISVLGWGDIYYNGPKSDVLKVLNEPVWSQAECRNLHPNWFKYDMFCALNREGGSGACDGDSGGPGMMGKTFIAGVHSWGVNCAKRDEPDYFYSPQYNINNLDFLLGITGVPVYGITGDIDENTGQFSFTAQSPYPGRTPDTPISWTMESDQGWSLNHGLGLTWSDTIPYPLDDTQIIRIITRQGNGVWTSRNIIIHPVGVVYFPVMMADY